MISKADSIECKDETQMSSESLLQQSNAQPVPTELPCANNNKNNNNINNNTNNKNTNDNSNVDVVEVVTTGDAFVIEVGRKLSVVEEHRTSECELSKHDSSMDAPQMPSLIKQSSTSLASLPASISTQTLPMQDYPELSGSSSTLVDQPIDVDEAMSQSKVITADSTAHPHDVQRKSSSEVDRRTIGIKKAKSRSIEEKDKKMSCSGSDDGSKMEDICQDKSGRSSFDEQQNQRHCCKQSSLTHQPSQVSQDDDYEIAMVSGLLPGCVGEFKVFK